MISIILPTKNEPLVNNLIEEIKIVLKELDKPFEIIAIDDSKDDTFKKLRSLGIKTIKQSSKGLGGALIEGFHNANGDYIITMDADFSHRPDYIPKLLKKCEEGFDIVIGSRREPGGKIIGWNLTRKTISLGANFIGRHFAGIKVSDITSGYRLYRKHIIKDLRLDQMKSKGYSFQLEVLARAKKKNFKIGTIPIIFYDRKKGKSKLSKKEFFTFIITALSMRFSKI